MPDRFDVDAAADAVLPLGGPYTPETLAAAADLTAELVRRLNHATRRNMGGIRQPADADRLVQTVARTAAYLTELCGRLAERVGDFEDQPGVYTTGPGTAGQTIVQAAGRLYRAGGYFEATARVLNEAGGLTSRLGTNDPEES